MELLIPILIFSVLLIGSIIYEKRRNRFSSSSRNNNQRISSHQIRWKNIPNSSSSTTPGVWSSNVPDDINNILKLVIGNKDPVTQEPFLPEQKVYFCRRCRLAYHEDSWQALNQKCNNCNQSDKTGVYSLPNPKK